nr:hypothetical protein [Tanacetum cinerariifolium]
MPELLHKLLRDLQIISEELPKYINLSSWNCPAFYDDDDDNDEESFTPLRDTISELPLSVAITPDFSIADSLIMEDKHLDTIPETESDEEHESSVKDLNLTPSESEDLFDIKSIENDDYDSEGDIFFLEEFISNDFSSLPENESFHFDVPSSPRPPAKPPDDEIYFKPDTGLLTTKVVGDISKQCDLMPRLLPTQPTICPVIDTLLPFHPKMRTKFISYLIGALKLSSSFLKAR